MNRSLLDKVNILAPIQRQLDDGKISDETYMEIMEWVYDDSIPTGSLHDLIASAITTSAGSDEPQ